MLLVKGWETNGFYRFSNNLQGSLIFGKHPYECVCVSQQGESLPFSEGYWAHPTLKVPWSCGYVCAQLVFPLASL